MWTDMMGLQTCAGVILLALSLAVTEDVKPSDEDEDTSGRGWAPALEGVWSPLLEEWALMARAQKVMKPQSLAQGKREVTETDLYLLGAIEKLVYRVDFMEKRLRRTEELLYHVMANGGNTAREDPCPSNFTRTGRNCYHFIQREHNWKAAALMCKNLGSTLAELESIEENQDVVTFIQAHADLRGNDYWTGGLNPGLLWIWANSARPVAANNTESSVNNIRGSGRCLKLAFNPATRAYAYQGSDCSIRSYAICELEENSTGRALERIAKSLKERQPPKTDKETIE